MEIWQRVLRLLILIHANCVVTWGAARWGILEGQLLLYEKEDIVEAFHIVPPHIQMVQPFISDSLQFRDDIIWKTISSILMWVIWKVILNSRYPQLEITLTMANPLLQYFGQYLKMP